MDFSSPQFAAPGWLWLALIAPVVHVLLCAHAARERRRQLQLLVEPALQPALLQSHSSARRIVKNILVALALASIGVALARPQWGVQHQSTNLQGEDIVIALDCSRSMLATDIRPDRLTRAKAAILDFVQSRPGGRVGLVAFAGQAFVQCPLTFDYDAFRECLNATDDKAIPVQGTDLSRALEEAVGAMEKTSRRKLLILVTDGEDLEKQGVQKAHELAEAGVVIYTIGVGTGEGRPIEIIGEKGPDVLRDKAGQVVVSRLDEDTLRAIAIETGGTYEPLGAVGQGLIRIRERIDSAADRAKNGSVDAIGIERFHWFVGAALALAIVESLIGTRRRMSENPLPR